MVKQQERYKVGDRVRIVDKWTPGCFQNFGGLMDKWLGKVMTIRQVRGCAYLMEEDRHERLGMGWVWHPAAIAGPAETEKIIITTDGETKTTLARRYFDGNLAEPAQETEKKYRVLDRAPMAGDLVRLKTNGGYFGVSAGEVYPVKRVSGEKVYISGKHLPKEFRDEVDYIFLHRRECEIVEDLTAWGGNELEPLPEPEYDPDDVRLTHPAEPDEDDESGCTPEDVETIPDAIGFLYSVRDSLQEVTFTAAGDIIAKFK